VRRGIRSFAFEVPQPSYQQPYGDRGYDDRGYGDQGYRKKKKESWLSDRFD